MCVSVSIKKVNMSKYLQRSMCTCSCTYVSFCFCSHVFSMCFFVCLHVYLGLSLSFSVCASKAPGCFEHVGLFAGTHGDVLNVHRWSECRTTHHTALHLTSRHTVLHTRTSTDSYFESGLSKSIDVWVFKDGALCLRRAHVKWSLV